MILVRLSDTPPQISPRGEFPDIRLDARLGRTTLLGADLEPDTVESGARLHLRLYWRLDQGVGERIRVTLGNEVFAEYEIGLGNLPRNQDQSANLVGRVIVEDYWLVIPSTTTPGKISLEVGLVGSNEMTNIGKVLVVDEEETMERWLRIAGKSSLVP
jgi:hypothetical protein